MFEQSQKSVILADKHCKLTGVDGTSLDNFYI